MPCRGQYLSKPPRQQSIADNSRRSVKNWFITAVAGATPFLGDDEQEFASAGVGSLGWLARGDRRRRQNASCLRQLSQ